jgi:1-piperideine-2-carboxylate/1-pyrroline-2-carboxylate reductase [NAD(P)H]
MENLVAIVSPHDAGKTGVIVHDRARTEALLEFPALVDALALALQGYAQGAILSPERQVVPLQGDGVLLSMPATATDIAIHKLVNVNPQNKHLGLPTIHGQVSVFDAVSGRPLFILDGPEVTGRRTAAMSMLGVRQLSASAPREVLLIGTGTQARYHLQALAALHPACMVWVRGSSRASSEAFCAANAHVHAALRAADPAHVPSGVDLVIAATTSRQACYTEAGQAGRLVIGVGAFRPDMAEIGAATLADSDVYVDDIHGAPHEAGDLIQAGVDWARVRPLASALGSRHDPGRPVVFKTVGSAAWDLAACRVACAALQSGA